jgi:hypothetical protein
MGMSDPDFLDTVARCEKLERKLKKHPMFKAASSAKARSLTLIPQILNPKP